MNNKNSRTATICIVLVILSMAIGIFIGVLIGKSMGSGDAIADSDSLQSSGTDTVDVDTSETDTADANTADTDTADADIVDSSDTAVTETVPETLEDGSELEAEEIVLTVNGQEITMAEMNYYLFQQRDYYVNLYGEDPWELILDDGLTVAEYAKEQLYEDIVKTLLLIEQAQAYGIALSEEQQEQLSEEARTYIDTLGEDVCEQFGLELSAITQVYEISELSSEVYNEIWDDLSDQLLEDDAYSELSDDEFESAVSEAFTQLYEEWMEQAEIETTEVWDSIVVGSVG